MPTPEIKAKAPPGGSNSVNVRSVDLDGFGWLGFFIFLTIVTLLCCKWLTGVTLW